MTQVSRHPAYLLIEDQLDAIGQKWRVVRLVRGGMWWVAWGLVATVMAAMAAHWVGAGLGARGVWWSWVGWMVGSLVGWVVRPLVMRPRAVEVARLVEGRVEGLHDGLTNAVLLARAGDVAGSPWLGAIFDEVLSSTRGKGIDAAVRWDELRGLALKLAGPVAVAVVVGLVAPRALAHGWRQMWAPGAFVPVSGEMVIEAVTPGDTTLVSGQPLEVSVVAWGPGSAAEPEARLVFEHSLGEAMLVPTRREDGKLAYAYRADFVERSVRYRVEVGGTQSRWFEATVVPDVKLTELTLHVTPPAYTKREPTVVRLKGEALGETPITVPQGSRVEATVAVDVAMAGAMLRLGGGEPVAMRGGGDGRVFVGGFDAVATTALSAMLTSASGQITAEVPGEGVTIGVTVDGPPTVEMRWPTVDVAVAPDAEVKIAAGVKDDYPVGAVRVLMGADEGGVAAGTQQAMTTTLAVVHERQVDAGAGVVEHVLEVPKELRRHGRAVRVQVEAVDNRAIAAMGAEGGPQVTRSSVFEVRFRDPQQIAKEQKEKADRLRAKLTEMLRQQQGLHAAAVAFEPAKPEPMAKIEAGQVELRQSMQATAEQFEFDENDKVIQKTLLVLVHNPAKEAVDLAAAIRAELVESQRATLNGQLQGQQRRIISTLESLLAVLDALPGATEAEKEKRGGDLKSAQEEIAKLNEALKEFMKEQQRILDQSAALVKKPVDDWDEEDRKLLDELRQSQEKLDAFMQQKVNDFSKLAEQDMANASLLKELMEVYSEVTMAKEALKKDPIEIAVALEESGLELAKEISSNLEKWLMDTPDRVKWTMEDPVERTDTPMAELPDELEDMVGELMEQQEDLFDDIEDTNANWTDSLDKGAGWDAADGPIANMTAKGVTGNQLPNNNEMGGRSGEGRSGKSQGEFVEETASGKGGRNTPTRLDPTAFQQGQVKDESKDPVGGATGGGKISGQGGEGLEGPVPNRRDVETERLRQKQASIRNAAERLNVQLKLGRYDSSKLLESIALMRRVESDLEANRYQTALRRKDVLLDRMDTSHLLLSGRIHVEHDTTPTIGRKMEEQIHDSMRGDLPPAWEGALKEYYEKLGRE